MANEIYILRKDGFGVGQKVLTNPETPIMDYTVSLNHMGDKTISITFFYPELIDFNMKEYVVYEKEGVYANDDPLATETYYLSKPPTRTKNNTSLMVEYSCVFVAKQEILKSIPMIDSFESLGSGQAPRKPHLYQTEYSYFGGAHDYYVNIVSSMIAEFGYEIIDGIKQPKGWRFHLDLDNGFPQVGEDSIITISSMNVFDALKNLYDLFKVPFFTYDNNVVVGGEKKYVNHVFRYGKNKGLYKLTRTPDEASIITKIRGVGAERNIPYNYLQQEKADAGIAGIPMARLMPKIYRDTLQDAALDQSKIDDIKEYYISDDFDPDFPKVSFETYDDIYPTITGSTYNSNRIDIINGVYFNASSVSNENSTIVKSDNEEYVNPRFWIKIPALGFDLVERLNEKEPLILSPTTGMAGGARFEVLAIGSKPDSWSSLNDVGVTTEKFTFDTVALRRNWNNEGTVSNTQMSKVLQLKDGDAINLLIVGEFKTFSVDASSDFNMLVKMNIYKNDVLIETPISIYYDNRSNLKINEKKTYKVTGDGEYKVEIESSVSFSKESADEGDVALDIDLSGIDVGVKAKTASDEYENTSDTSTWLLVKKDIETYNALIPYVSGDMWTTFDNPTKWSKDESGYKAPDGIVPKIGDEYVFLGINLPQIYITNAEQRLEDAMKADLMEHQNYKYTYDCGFDEKMLIVNPSINTDVQIGSIMKIHNSIDPKESIDMNDVEEFTINSLTLKYKSDSNVPTIE